MRKRIPHAAGLGAGLIITALLLAGCAPGGPDNSAGKVTTVSQAEIDKAREIASRMEMVSVDGLANKEAALGAISERDSSARIGAYGDMAGAAQGFFDQNSEGYKLLGGISKAFHLLEIGFSAQAMVAKLFADETVAQSSVASGARPRLRLPSPTAPPPSPPPRPAPSPRRARKPAGGAPSPWPG